MATEETGAEIQDVEVTAPEAPEETTPEATPEVEAEQKVNPRVAQLNEIAARVREASAEQVEEPAADEPQEPEVIEPDPQPVAKPAFDIFDQDGVQMVRQKIHGQEQVVPLEQALRQAQKAAAADQSLEYANQTLREAAQREEQAKAREALVSQQLQRLTELQEKSNGTGQVDRKKLSSVVESIYNGELDSATDTFADTLEKILSAGRQTQATPGVTSDDITAVVHQELQRRSKLAAEAAQRQEIEKAVSVFEAEFPDIAQDPRLSAYFDRESELVIAENPGMSMTEVARISADNIRKLANQKDSRISKKRQMPRPNPRSTQASISTTVEPDPPRKTASSVIQNMRRTRGQAPM